MLLSYMISGHHGGLPNGGTQEGELHHRLKYGKVPTDVALLPNSDIKKELLPPFRLKSSEHAGFFLAFFTRMIFSCLVDADFLDTERFCSPEKTTERPEAGQELIPNMKAMLDAHLAELAERAEPTQVNIIRKEILAQCRAKAELPPQIFSLTVPTGGGKTLSSLAFALDHAVIHNMRRVIYAIPFTSIIEQNAKVFQNILGREHVLEHHCNFLEKDDPEESGYNRRRGLAAENWNLPIIVTTNVQFFESLFSNKPSRCRKLHNITGSVIVLDEAQAIPTEYLEPCLATLRELVEHYGCTVVLCTATQPAFDDKSNLHMALPEINEIITNPDHFYEKLRRTQVHFFGALTDADLAAKLGAENKVLCIVPTKHQARALFAKLKEQEGVFHLSTNMYPAHRRRVLDEIRVRLTSGRTCRVISTSLVEAGVDLDFPLVYRAMAGLDSIAQAAGRCNREGRLNGFGKLGQVYVYEPEKEARMPWLRRCISRAAETLRCLPGAEPLGMEVMRRYFELLYDVQELDKKQIMPRLNQMTRDLYFPFRDIAGEFQFIEDDTIGVIVPGEPESETLVRELRYAEYPKATLRKLQQYSVSVRMRELAALKDAGTLEMINGEFPILLNTAAYREDVGLFIEGCSIWNPEELVY